MEKYFLKHTSKDLTNPIKKLLFQLFFSFFIVSVGFGQTHTYYISGSGNDNNTGSIENPFKTIQKAAGIMNAGDSCLIRGGTYRETIIPARSGAWGKPILFMPYSCEKVIISGADSVAGPWAVYNGSIYKRYMPWTMGLGKDMVFVDGKLVVQARHPNKNSGAMTMPAVTVPLSPLWPHAFGKFNVTKGSYIITDSADLNQSHNDYWKGALYLGFHKWSWCMQSADISGSSTGQISYANRTSQWWFPDDADIPDYSYLYNSIQNGYLTNHIHALDQPGEWHWQNDTLYLWTSSGSDPSGSVIEAKRRQLAFDLHGRDFISLKNLIVTASSVNMYNSNNCVVNGCRLSYISHFQRWDDSREGLIDNSKSASESGALFKGEVGIIIGGNDNTVKNCIIEYSSGAGLYLNGNRTNVENCIIHDCGYTSTYLGCIYIFNDHLNPTKRCGGHTITHCDLYNSGRAVISVFGNQTQTLFDAMEISYNRIHDGCMLGNDGGLFNSWSVTLGTDNQKTQIHHNLIWDQWGQFWAGLVYPDNNSYKMEAHHNVLWYSANNTYDLKGRLFWKANTPNDCTYHDNVEKNGYAGGVSGLSGTDYPGGFFQTGPSFNLAAGDCLVDALITHPLPGFTFGLYPNPANSTVNISYQLLESQWVKIALYNILGKEILVLANLKQETGEYMVAMDTVNFQNGIYFLKMSHNQQQIMKKLIVRK